MDQQQFQTAVLERLDAMNERMDVSDANLQLLTTDHQNFKTAVIGHFETLEKRMDARFDLVGKRFDLMDTPISMMQSQMNTMQLQTGSLITEIQSLRFMIDTDRGKLEEIYQSRNLVKIRYGMEWMVASFIIAVAASGITLGFGRS